MLRWENRRDPPKHAPIEAGVSKTSVARACHDELSFSHPLRPGQHENQRVIRLGPYASLRSLLFALLVNLLRSGECLLPLIMLRIPRQRAPGVVDVVPQLINVEVLPLATAARPMSGQREAGILRDTDRDSRKLRPGAQRIDPGRVHALT